MGLSDDPEKRERQLANLRKANPLIGKKAPAGGGAGGGGRKSERTTIRAGAGARSSSKPAKRSGGGKREPRAPREPRAEQPRSGGGGFWRGLFDL